LEKDFATILLLYRQGAIFRRS